jgi:hypothetical protein
MDDNIRELNYGPFTVTSTPILFVWIASDKVEHSRCWGILFVTTIHDIVREKEEADVELGTVVSIAGVVAMGKKPQ